MDTFLVILQILGGIFLALLLLGLLVFAGIAFAWWRFTRGLKKFGRDMKDLGWQLGPIVGVNTWNKPRPGRSDVDESSPMPRSAAAMIDVAPSDVWAITRSKLDEDLLAGAVGNGLVTSAERDHTLTVHAESDVEQLIDQLQLDNTPIFDPPDHRTGKEFLRDGPTRQAFAKLNGMRMDGDQFEHRGTVTSGGVEADVYVRV